MMQKENAKLNNLQNTEFYAGDVEEVLPADFRRYRKQTRNSIRRSTKKRFR